MLIEDHFFYTLVSRKFYESFDAYHPDLSVYYDVVCRKLRGWSIERAGIWFVCHPDREQLPHQGWKIHVSAIPLTAPQILATTAHVLGHMRIPFKFALDSNVLLLLIGKRWGRGGAGKFITVYPRHLAQFREVIEALYHALAGHAGPYILSDRRYKDSGVVYYRYGGIDGLTILNVRGEQIPVLMPPDGAPVPDRREPYCIVPKWTSDPFRTEETPATAQCLLKGGRYTIEGAVAFSASGGVYTATDNENSRKVIVKEARPFTNMSPTGVDAVTLLKKEHRLLSTLEDANVAPHPVDFFKEWEHWFLVEEFVEGIVLRTYAAANDIAVRTRLSLADTKEFYTRFCALYSRIIDSLEVLHNRGIVFADVSHYNILVVDNGGDIRFIDFEGAYEPGVDPPSLIYTPGFATTEMMKGELSRPEDDYYGIGSLMFAGLMPINNIFTLDPRTLEYFLSSFVRDLGLPQSFRRVVGGLLHTDRNGRLTGPEALQLLASANIVEAPQVDASDATEPCCRSMVQRILDYILSVATYERRDRLFPGDSAVFSTNPLSVAYGACGVSYVLQKITGQLPSEVTHWMLQQRCDNERYPPGLYVGLSGVAWVFHQLGLTNQAQEAIEASWQHPLLYDCPDLFYGVAGCGLAQLKFFLETEDDVYLCNAVAAGNYLLRSRQEHDSGYYWPALGEVWLGLAHGGSGIALFLLYLYAVTTDERFLVTCRRALDFVLANGTRNADAGLTWIPKLSGFNSSTPYWRYGSAGVGMVLLRAYGVTGDIRYKQALDDIILDTDRKYAVFPGQLFGLAGIGQFLLDMADFFSASEEWYLQMVRKVASGILLFRLEQEDGSVAFPGEQVARISCDYGTGSAGIALFFDRLLNRGVSDFMLDEVLTLKGCGFRNVGRTPATDSLLITWPGTVT